MCRERKWALSLSLSDSFNKFLSFYLEVLKKVRTFAIEMINRTECIQKLEACKDVVADRFGVRSILLFRHLPCLFDSTSLAFLSPYT